MSTSHPLTYAREFGHADTIDLISKAIHAPSKVTFFVSSLFGQTLSYTPLVAPIFYPSSIVHNLAADSESALGKIKWIAPLVGISSLALVGRAAFNFASNSLLKGLVYGVHSAAMGMLTNIPRGSSLGLITLRNTLGGFMGMPSIENSLSDRGIRVTKQRSETLSGIAFVTASLGLSFFAGTHVILANTAAHVAAATTKAVSARIFAHFAEPSAIPEVD